MNIHLTECSSASSSCGDLHRVDCGVRQAAREDCLSTLMLLDRHKLNLAALVVSFAAGGLVRTESVGLQVWRYR
ncbi:hypothetical protein ACVXG7_29645 [Enterobacter hormaechei]